MSKSKKRILHGNKLTGSMNCTRNDAVELVVKSVKTYTFDKSAQNLISLFGITGEELAEAGLTWEELQIVKPYL